MQVLPIRQFNQNNNQKVQKPSFQALKIDYAGLYRKEEFPEHAKMVVNSIKGNKVFTDFCKKHDVEVLLSAYKEGKWINTYFDMVVVKPVNFKLLKFFGLDRKKIISIEKDIFFNYLTDDIAENFSNKLWICSKDLSNELSEYNGKTYGELTCKILEINKK